MESAHDITRSPLPNWFGWVCLSMASDVFLSAGACAALGLAGLLILSGTLPVYGWGVFVVFPALSLTCRHLLMRKQQALLRGGQAGGEEHSVAAAAVVCRNSVLVFVARLGVLAPLVAFMLDGPVFLTCAASALLGTSACVYALMWRRRVRLTANSFNLERRFPASRTWTVVRSIDLESATLHFSEQERAIVAHPRDQTDKPLLQIPIDLIFPTECLLDAIRIED